VDAGGVDSTAFFDELGADMEGLIMLVDRHPAERTATHTNTTHINATFFIMSWPHNVGISRQQNKDIKEGDALKRFPLACIVCWYVLCRRSW
jgi:hypothetical protein